MSSAVDIVVVGAGKAGSLHYRAYERLGRRGRLDPARIHFVDRARRTGPDLAALLAGAPGPVTVHGGRDELPELDRGTTIVDLCLPSRELAPALVDWWRAGFRRFLVEKPFLVAPEWAAEITEVAADSQVVLMRNYLHSKVHATVRGLIEHFDLDPVLCVTNFSKDRRADNRRGRGGSGATAPTVYEVEMPHQLYIGADLLGRTRSVVHAEDRDPTGEGRLGEGLMVGHTASGAAFVHYSNLHHPTVVRSLDLFCRDQLSIHAAYVPICEEFVDIKAGVVLARGDTVLAKTLYTSDDNMLAMISAAHETLTGGTGAPLDVAGLVRDDAVIRAAIDGTTWSDGEPSTARTDVLQQWIVDSFTTGLGTGLGAAFLRHLERSQRRRLSEMLPALATAITTGPPTARVASDTVGVSSS